MSGKGKNVAASVAARLLDRAKRSGSDYQMLLTTFCFERFLYRLGLSPVRDRFILKGAMLLRVWSEQPYRATRDLDLLRRGDSSFEAVREDIRVVCSTPVEADGVFYDSDSASVEPIRSGTEYVGTRAELPVRCDRARLILQIDVGIGDSVWPAPQRCDYPTLLDFSAPNVLAYPREAVVAEKLEAMVVLGNRNSRIKDFFDLYYLANEFEFDFATLTESVRQTFSRRRTPFPDDEPVALTSAYWRDPSRPSQIRAFARRAGLTLPVMPEDSLQELLSSFLQPILDHMSGGGTRPNTWKPGGPWT